MNPAAMLAQKIVLLAVHEPVYASLGAKSVVG